MLLLNSLCNFNYNVKIKQINRSVKRFYSEQKVTRIVIQPRNKFEKLEEDFVRVFSDEMIDKSQHQNKSITDSSSNSALELVSAEANNPALDLVSEPCWEKENKISCYYKKGNKKYIHNKVYKTKCYNKLGIEQNCSKLINQKKRRSRVSKKQKIE